MAHHNLPKKNFRLDSSGVKNRILSYLYDSGVKINSKIHPVGNEEDMDKIRIGNYIICPRYFGTPSWIIFVKLKDIYYAVSFPKYQKKYENKINIFPVELSVNSRMYLGTIMEGIYYQIESEKYIIVDEVYILSGENQLLKSKEDRLSQLSDYFSVNIQQKPGFKMYVSLVFEINENNLQDLFQKIKINPLIRDIIFYPKIYGGKIYSYTIAPDDKYDQIIKVSTFHMQKTKTPDVYPLYVVGSDEKIGIAFVQTIACTKKFKQWFKDNNTSDLIVKCHLLEKNKKWVPVEIIDKYNKQAKTNSIINTDSASYSENYSDSDY